jgi:hypothetical protein
MSFPNRLPKKAALAGCVEVAICVILEIVHVRMLL